jgi:hypothetical protein
MPTFFIAQEIGLPQNRGNVLRKLSLTLIGWKFGFSLSSFTFCLDCSSPCFLHQPCNA